MLLLVYFKLKEKIFYFCIEELKALLQLYNVDLKEAFAYQYDKLGKEMPKMTKDIKEKDFPSFPFVYIELPNQEIAEKIINRSVLIR